MQFSSESDSVDITSKGDTKNKRKKEIPCNKLRYYSLLIVFIAIKIAYIMYCFPLQRWFVSPAKMTQTKLSPTIDYFKASA